MKTIWGQTQEQKKLAEGVYDVDTARHGGIIVSDDVADKYLSDAAKEVADHAYGWWHFEEDCDWAVFAYENKQICPSNWTDEMIMRSLENYNMGYLESRKEHDMERHYYEELMTLASGIYHWAHAASEQNGSVNDIKICLQEMRSRCKQAENLSIICQYGIIEDIIKKGE